MSNNISLIRVIIYVFIVLPIVFYFAFSVVMLYYIHDTYYDTYNYYNIYYDNKISAEVRNSDLQKILEWAHRKLQSLLIWKKKTSSGAYIIEETSPIISTKSLLMDSPVSQAQ